LLSYNNQGKLDSIPGIVTSMDYNAVGQMALKSYANGKSTAYSYNNQNLRLNRIAAQGIQDLIHIPMTVWAISKRSPMRWQG
jgi:YD repeat-containing protein